MAPNLLERTVEKIWSWQNLFSLINPIFFYIPLAPAAIVVLILLYFKTNSNDRILRRRIKAACIFGVLALVFGIYIITQINLKLFFADVNSYANKAYKMAVLWNILNGVRVALLGFSVYNIFKAYILTQRKEDV